MNKVILAPAGGRKTQSIIDECLINQNTKKLIITFTTTGQEVLERRLWGSVLNKNIPVVTGWYSFLFRHFVRPYINNLYKGQKVNGLHFVTGQNPTIRRSGVDRYFDDDDRVYSVNIAKLSMEIYKKSSGAIINRLERIYDEIYIDEIQDLVGNDLEILELLFKSKIRIFAAGDIRQSILTTSRSDQKNKKYRDLNKIEWFRKKQSEGIFTLEERNETWRCNQQIIDFADSVLPKDLNFPRTISRQSLSTDHDGVFVVSWDNLSSYIDKYDPECYKDNKRTKVLDNRNTLNFGKCKGRTASRVLIYPTNPIKKFLKDSSNTLVQQSSSKLYVAITRAIHSVAFVVEKPDDYPIPEWKP